MNNKDIFCQVAKIAAEYDIREYLYWTKDLEASVDVSDLFYWACGDYEEITEENLPILRQAFEDVFAIDPKYGVGRCGAALFASRVRNMRPQGKYISDYVFVWADDMEVCMDGRKRLVIDEEKTRQMQELFFALPEREIDIANPYTTEGVYEYRSEPQ